MAEDHPLELLPGVEDLDPLRARIVAVFPGLSLEPGDIFLLFEHAPAIGRAEIAKAHRRAPHIAVIIAPFGLPGRRAIAIGTDRLVTKGRNRDGQAASEG